MQLAIHEKESMSRAFEVLQKQHEESRVQQTHWSELRQATEKIDLLTNLIGQVENEELQELRRYREQGRTLEVEHSDLQKRVGELENYLKANEKNLTSTRQSLAQSQQRLVEWEHRGKEAEGQLEMARTKLDQVEQTHVRLEADYSIVKLQLDEFEGRERVAEVCYACYRKAILIYLLQERESRMRETMTVLENKVRMLQTELEKKTNVVKTSASTTPNYRHTTNGYSYSPIRPESRGSTIYTHRSVTPTRRVASYIAGSSSSVRDSMHAPHGPVKYPSLSTMHAPTVRYPSNFGLGRGGKMSSRTQVRQPSPAGSVVSNAPTLGEDGWWE